ncbi:MAG: hypothetical protein IPM24_23995 [Bryobacterales bacterium]|nr:hypothetical protein [Bryobacterales bacterium]
MSEHPTASLRTIGVSAMGRPIQVRHFGREDAPLRIFLLCGQHGDERAVRRSLRAFLRAPCLDPHVQVAALDLANPDGGALRTRPNALGIDLNRDHLLLRAPETRALHGFVRAWQPHLVADFHNYPSRRLPLLARNARLGWDVCVDFPTNPAAVFREGHPLLANLAASLLERLRRSGFCCGRYAVFQPNGTVRHGTPHLVDARTVLALRYDIPTVLIEARTPSSHHGAGDRSRLRDATVLACQELLRWCGAHASLLQAPPEPVSDAIPVRYRRRRVEAAAEIPVADLQTGEVRTERILPYRPVVEGRRRISPPAAYAVPLTGHPAMDLLVRHGFQSFAADPRRTFEVEQGRVHLPGYALFPMRQTGGSLLPLLLESGSRYGPQTDCEAAAPVQRVLSRVNITIEAPDEIPASY